MRSAIPSRSVVTVWTIAAAAAGLLQNTQVAKAVTAAGETGLLYSDRSAGALSYAHVWYKVATSNGIAVTYTHDAEEFTQRLTSATWTNVAIMSRYTGSEPAYVSAVRSYASAHPEALIEFRVWHDNGQSAPALTAVLGTNAIVTWNHGMTITGYALAGGTVGGAPPTGVSGQVYPTFVNVTPRRWDALWSVSSASFESAVYPAEPTPQPNPCVEDCVSGYMADWEMCKTNHDYDVKLCDRLYGPGRPGWDPTVHPAQYTQCVEDAHKTHTACLRGADQRAKNCALACLLPAN